MRKFLVVGCGGSGGATLAYMMDQLRSELASAGIGQIPAGWQFIHLDVPTSPTPVKGVGTVRQQGGTYVGTGPSSDSYKVLDNALSGSLANNGALGTIATWAPRIPESITTPLSTGAGQYRGLGRMITLRKVGEIRSELQKAFDRLNLVSTDSEMKTLSIPGAGPYYSSDVPIVLVVSSMAGGAGASMALDICRVLTMVTGVDPRLMGVFMVAPDIFDKLPADKVTGVRANALAMLGEIVASQTGAAREHDVTLLRALGLDNGEGELIPFARVFPVGGFVGAERTQFGDGTQDAVYRGLGRGLAALMLSGAATQQFVEWDLTNGAGLPGSREFLGWGNQQWNNIPWGTFGFARFSMGRDRYAKYAAQRLARAGVDQLLRGHQQPGNTASDEEQVNAILDGQWGNITRELGLPDLTGAAPESVGSWIGDTVLPAPALDQITGDLVVPVWRDMPKDRGVATNQWASRVRQVLDQHRENLRSGAQQAAYGIGFHWQQYLVARLEQVVEKELARLGMPYATALVKRVQRTLQELLSAGQALAKTEVGDLADVVGEARGIFAAFKSGTVADPEAILRKVLDGTRETLKMHVYAALADQIAMASGALVSEVCQPLVDALDESQLVLRQAAGATTNEVALAHLDTNEYAAWPSDRDEAVSPRFEEADNEVMLTSSADFKARYEVDLPQSVGSAADRRGMQEGVKLAAAYVISGAWETVGGMKAPHEERPVLERISAWTSKAFARHPESNEPLIAQSARYDVHVRPTELLDRAQRFIDRPGESFDRFCSVSLREFLTEAPESELASREQDMVTKFGEAMNLARPLASVNEKAMQALHGVSEMVYRYKFSAIPFRDMRIADALVSSLADKNRTDPETGDALRRVLSDERKVKHVDIFGSYPNYSPLAYTSVVEPAATQWLASSPAQRKQFWTLRRARPLAASLPMHPLERRAMVAGWLLGYAIGFIQQPSVEPYNEPAKIWDTEGQRWLEFPNPLLTPPSEFNAPYDWLPAILEGSLIAIAQSHQPPVMSKLYPYRALRRIYDDSPEDPVSGLMTLSAKKHLTRWLRSGNAGSGMGSPIEGADVQAGIDDRAQLFERYLRDYCDLAGQHYMASGEGAEAGLPGAPGQGAFSVISVRPQASKTPIFRDIAADVFWATQKLIGFIPECVENAKRPEPSAGPTPPPMAPNADDFSIPQLGGSFGASTGGNS